MEDRARNQRRRGTGGILIAHAWELPPTARELAVIGSYRGMNYQQSDQIAITLPRTQSYLPHPSFGRG